MDKYDKILKSSLETERRCSKCHNTKQIGEFASYIKLDRKGNEVDVHQYQCKTCASLYGKEYRQSKRITQHGKINAWTFIK